MDFVVHADMSFNWKETFLKGKVKENPGSSFYLKGTSSYTLNVLVSIHFYKFVSYIKRNTRHIFLFKKKVFRIRFYLWDRPRNRSF
jgi:hypothetical protein